MKKAKALVELLKRRLAAPTIYTTAGVLLCTAVLHALYAGWPPRWFTLHPLLMFIGFLAAGPIGILFKRKGGRSNTLVHAYAMSLACVLSLGGWFVIYEQKNMLGKLYMLKLKL